VSFERLSYYFVHTYEAFLEIHAFFVHMGTSQCNSPSHVPCNANAQSYASYKSFQSRNLIPHLHHFC